MIDQVYRIETVKACDLPPTFSVRIGTAVYPMAREVRANDEAYIYVISLDNNERIFIPRNEEIAILVPETWEDARMDVEFALMQEGLI